MADVDEGLEAGARAAARGVRGTTRTVGIIGWPVEHSLSPVIHNAAFAALGLDWVYVPLPVPPDRLRDSLAGLAALGFAGANVTMPYKEESFEACATTSEDARLSRAVNTIVVGSDGLAGHNTDVGGFARFLSEDAGFDPAGRTALIYGAGGAARACALALARGGLRRLVAVVRDPSRGEGLRRVVGPLGTGVEMRTWGSPPDVDAHIVVNTTPIGSRDEELPPLPEPPIGPGMLVVDLLYRPPVTPLIGLARRAGATAHGGLGLLLRQAALSFELWTGHVPPIDVMSAAAVAELAETD